MLGPFKAITIAWWAQ